MRSQLRWVAAFVLVGLVFSVNGSVHAATLPQPAFLEYLGPSSVDTMDTAAFTAKLADSQGHPITGVPLTFDLTFSPADEGGVPESCPPIGTSPTDANGIASCDIGITPAIPPVDGILTIAFAGNSAYAPASLTSVIPITQEETTITYLGPTTLHLGQSVTFLANVGSDSTEQEPIESDVVFGLTSGGVFQSCIAGLLRVSATCTIDKLNLPKGKGQLTIEFLQSLWFAGSTLRLPVKILPN